MKGEAPFESVIKKIAIIVLLLIIQIAVFAQEVQVGKWKGKITEGQTAYDYTVQVNSVKGNTIEGVTISSNKDFNCTSSFIGTFKENQVMIREHRVISTNYPKPVDICLMKLDLRIDKADNIIGEFSSSNGNNAFCGRGIVKMKIIDKKIESDFSSPESVKGEVRKLVSLDSLEIRGDAGENSSPVVTNKVRAMSGLRKGILLDEWVIPLDSIRVEVYDNGVIDGDLISIVVNGEVRLSKVKLTDKPIGFDLFAHDLSGYTIEFFAENLGEIPPNTGLVVIRNGQFRRELTFSSDYKSSSYVKIRLAGIRND